MKKVKKVKRKIPLTIKVLVCFAIGLYILLRYYVAPGLFDSKNQYIKVYNYQTSSIKARQSTIKEINLEFIYEKEAEVPEGLTWSEITLTNADRYYKSRVILNAKLDDGTSVWIPLKKFSETGPAFSDKFYIDDKLFLDMTQRFPGLNKAYMSGYRLVFLSGMLYTGDTLYQIPKASDVTRFDLKNPRTGKLQTYYEYGNPPGKIIFPIYLKVERRANQDGLQEFYDDYNTSSLGYWDKSSDIPRKMLSHDFTFLYAKWYYSDALTNLPVSVKLTGSKFKISVTRTQLLDYGYGKVKVRKATKLYSEENKDEYIKEVLGDLDTFVKSNDDALTKRYKNKK